jgi:hypothetical protein
VSEDYCTFELDLYKDYVGAYILKEQLRQWSLWKRYGTQKYFKYTDLFDKLCTMNWELAKECGDKIIKEIDLPDIIKLEGTPTEIMDEWRIEQVAAGFLSTPELTIN